jgi:hypothetical protein
MGEFVVMKKVQWKPPIQAKLLTTPTLEISVAIDDSELKQMVAKQRVAFDAAWAKAVKVFDADFQKLGVQRIKDIQSAVKDTEAIIVKKEPKDRKAVVETSNKMLSQAFTVFQNQIQALAQKHYDASVEASQKAMKMKIVKARAKAIAKIIIVVALTLTAAGLAIALTVATGGIAAPVIIAALVTGGKAAASVYKTITTEWPNAANQMKLVQADTDKLRAAAKDIQDANALATTGAPSAVDKLKKAKGLFDGHLVNLDKHVGQLDKYIAATSMAIRKQNEQWQKLAKEINAGGDRALQTKVAELDRATMLAVGELAQIGDVKDEAAKVKAAWAANNSIGDLGALTKAAQGLVEVAPTVITVGKLGKDVLSGGQKLIAALK